MTPRYVLALSLYYRPCLVLALILAPHLGPIELKLGDSLAESGETIGHAYFPTDATILLLSAMEDGDSTETAVVGAEGVVGIALFMGSGTMPRRAIVQSAGSAYRLKGPLVKTEFDHPGPCAWLIIDEKQCIMGCGRWA